MTEGGQFDELKKPMLSTVFLDGALFVAVAMLSAVLVTLSGDDSGRFLEPKTLFWSKFWVGTFNSGILALKMYRSTQFADSKR